MVQPFDYNKYFDMAIEQIQQLRSPHAIPLTHQTLGWRIIQSQAMTNIGGDEYDRFAAIVPGARAVTHNCILNVLWQLLREKAPQCKLIPPNSEQLSKAGIHFAFIDTVSNCLVVVTDKEPDILCVADDYIPDGVAQLLRATGVPSYKHVYLLHDYAYLQYIKHIVDTDDPGHGCGAYSLSWLFDTYFGEGEYLYFKEALSIYKKRVDELLGYAIVRVLNRSALEKFRMITEKELLKFNYAQVDTIPVISEKKNQPPKPCSLEPGEYGKMQRQFIANCKYKVLLGQSDFAESLITAEWLRDSMRKAQAIDLTVIGTGYFKAAEQLLYCLAKLRFSDVDEKETFGNFAYRYQKNQKLFFHKDLLPTTREYVYESIYSYAKLRNGYFHKHNIHDPNRIEEIRTATFLLVFLLLGSQKLSGTDLAVLGTPALHNYGEFDKFCDYVGFHSNDYFCLEPDGFPEQWVQPVEMASIPASIKEAVTSRCLYFFNLSTKKVFRVTEENLPKRIWIGKLDIKQTDQISLDLVKEKLLFESGRYTIPALVDEFGFEY